MEFPTTRWTSVVTVAMQQGDSVASPDTVERADQALEELCRLYWFPIYAYARGRGNTHEDAQDLTQSFFQNLIEQKLVSRADRNFTKFRTFLLTQFKYVISNEWRARTAWKRGGTVEHLSFDFEGADEHFQVIGGGEQDPAVTYDRAWADQIVETTLGLLNQEYSRNNTDVPFAELRGYLPGGGAHPRVPYEELERRYSPVKAQALMTRTSRLNKRFRELLASVVADTVSDPAQVDEELRHLVQALTGS